jgi:elongation factor Ts
MGEKFDLRRFEVLEGPVGSYIHNGGQIATVVKLDKHDEELAKQLAMHIAANNPTYVLESDIPADVLAHEKEIQAEAAKTDPKLANKPAEVLSKILDGKVRKYFADSTLEHQAFLMDDSKTVGQLLKEKNVAIVKFVRYHVGEGIEKRQDDFASEVMSQVK